MNRDCDALVVGGGPAGAVAASVLAAAGKRTIVLERARFPRYSVGESLMPYCFFPLERIGVIEKVRRASFVAKYSVEFIGLDGAVSRPFYFDQHFHHEAARTWQVRRDEFDHILLEHARECGAEVVRGHARELLHPGGDPDAGVEGVGFDRDGRRGVIRAPITIDCSGLAVFAARRLGWQVMEPALRKVSIWSYYTGGRRNSGRDEGATTIALLPNKGWFWYIPVSADETSVGVTAEADYLFRGGRDPGKILEREAMVNPWICRNLERARRVAPVRVASDYSYRSRHCATDGLVLAGDAFAFLDPVYSSGVFLALWSGEAAAHAAVAGLDAGDLRASRFAAYGSRLIHGVEAMRKLVHAFYDEGFRVADLIARYPDLAPDLTDLLIGNLFRDFTRLHRAIGEFAKIPEDLGLGLPTARGTAAGAARRALPNGAAAAGHRNAPVSPTPPLARGIRQQPEGRPERR